MPGGGGEAERHAEAHADADRDERHRDRDPRPDHDHREDVAAEMVGAEPVGGGRRLQLVRDVERRDVVGGPEEGNERRGREDRDDGPADEEAAHQRPRRRGSTQA